MKERDARGMLRWGNNRKHNWSGHKYNYKMLVRLYQHGMDYIDQLSLRELVC